MTRPLAFAALLLAAPAALAAEDWRYGASAELVHDDNATRGLFDGKKADNVVSVEGSASRSFLLGEKAGALVRVSARYAHFADIRDISNLALTGRAAWRYQPSLEFGATWFELAGQAQVLRHADSPLRDGSIVTFEAGVGRHVTDRVRLKGGIGFDERSGDGTGVYDLSNTRLWGSMDYRVGVRNTLYGRLSYIAGDQVFNVIPALGLGVWAPDPALASVYGAPGNAYRVDATTQVYELGYNYPLGSGRALDFLFTRISSKAEEGIGQGEKYIVNQLRATYLHRFR